MDYFGLLGRMVAPFVSLTSRRVLLYLVAFAPCWVVEADVFGWKSPNGLIECYAAYSQEDNKQYFFLMPIKTRQEGAFLKKVGRYAEVMWSPDSKFLALTVHWTGHDTAIEIFSVKMESGRIKVNQIYQAPPSGPVYVTWKILSWNPGKQQVVLSRTEPAGGNARTSTLTVDLNVETGSGR
jgi:hypothetical protein